MGRWASPSVHTAKGTGGLYSGLEEVPPLLVQGQAVVEDTAIWWCRFVLCVLGVSSPRFTLLV